MQTEAEREGGGAAAAAPTSGETSGMTADRVAGFLSELAASADLGPLDGASPAQLCDLLTGLEELKHATAAAQARVTVLTADKLRQQALDQGVAPSRADKGISGQVALARRESPHAGARHLGFSRILITELPRTHAAMTAGLVSEWTAMSITQETACLSLADRTTVDEHLSGRFGTESHKQLVAAARALSYELDPYAATNRGRKAAKDRRISIRPAPDVMTIVTGYLPVAQGVACYKSLDEAARALRAAGDERTLDQIRADLFTQRLTGQATAEGVDVEVGLVMSDGSLFGTEETPARMAGYGPIPAPMARDLIRGHRDEGHTDTHTTQGGAATSGGDSAGPAGGTAAWLRRLYADPVTGELTAQDARKRRFTGPLRRHVIARDQVCRTPWCDAPIRHADHIHPWSRGGETTKDNGDGLCEACNYTKEAPGWSHERVPQPDGSHRVQITTPTGHTYDSQAPPVLWGRAADQIRAGPPAVAS